MALDLSTLPGPFVDWRFDAADATALTCVRNWFNDASAVDDNLLPACEQFYNPSYATGAPAFYQQLGLTITEGFTDPFGGNRATRIQGTGVKLLQSQPTASALIPAGTYTLSGYFKSNNGVASNGWAFNFGGVNGDAGMTLNIPNTGVWQRFSYSFTVNGTQTDNRFVLYKDAADNCDFLMYGLKLNPGGSATPYVQPDWELRIGLGTQRPTWTSEGLTLDSGDRGLAFGQVYPEFTAQTGHMCILVDDASASRILLRDILSYPAIDPGYGVGTINSQGANRQGINVGGGLLRTISPIDDTKYHTLSWVFDGATLRYFLDGTFLYAVEATDSWTSLGFLLSDGSLPFVGKVGRIVMYDEAHTDAQVRSAVAQIASDMDDKGVTVNDLQTLLVFEGDSISELFGDWTPYSYTFQVLQEMVIHGVSHAVSGNEVSDLAARAETIDAILLPGKQYPILNAFVATNNLANADTAEEVYAEYKAYCQARKAAGWFVMGWTVMPRNVVGFEAKRLAYNTLVRTNGIAEGWLDYLCDIGADETLGDVDNLGTAFLDGIHPDEAGHTILKEYTIAGVEAVQLLPPKEYPDEGGGSSPHSQYIANVYAPGVWAEGVWSDAV